MNPNRSVVDFDSEEALRKALLAVKLPEDDSTLAKEDESVGPEVRPNDPDSIVQIESENRDWMLSSFDPETTEAQSMKEELHRLQVLKSYVIIDAEREEAFERLTRVAARFFHAPIALISLVDLGRQWFMSNRGLGDVRETPRKHAFCAHAILNKRNILIVPDATKDFRFKSNPLVTGPPNIRFYAGAPLISPEGYKLGTFCVIDDNPRPAGLSQDDQASLRDFADMAVKEMVERRNNLKRHQSPSQLIAYTAHDLMTPLTAVQLSLSLLSGDKTFMDCLGGHLQELISTAISCNELMIRICQTAIDTLRHESSVGVPDVLAPTKGSKPVTKIAELVRSLLMIMDLIPKTSPFVVTVDSDVPNAVITDDLKLFRSALNLIANGVERTSLGLVHLRIFVEPGATTKLVFECTDTGPKVLPEEYQYLFRPTRTPEGDIKLGLSSVATMINSLDGEYGFRNRDSPDKREQISTESQGAIFWFNLPFTTPAHFGVDADDELSTSIIRTITSSQRIHNDLVLKQPILPVIKSTCSTEIRGDTSVRHNHSNEDIKSSASTNTSFVRNTSANTVASTGNMRISTMVGDPLQATAINNSCLRGVFDPVVAGSNEPAVPLSVAVSRLSNGSHPSTCLQSIQRKRRALVIEDSLVVRKSLARALENMGMIVTQAVNGLEGLKSMKSSIFDFVLCDFLMPVMDGLDCVKQYRDWEQQHRPDVRQYIVGISAHGGANDGNKGIKAGMNEFRPKPVSIKVLREIQKTKEVNDLSRILDEIDETNSGFRSASSSVTSLAAQDPQLQCSPLKAGIGLACGSSLNVQTFQGDSTTLSGQQNSTFVHVTESGAKRVKIDQGFVLSSELGSQACLLAMNIRARRPSNVIAELEEQGWKVIVVHDGQNALHLLKMRNWNAVLIDDDLPLSGGAECANEFRAWEQHNRVNRQRNVILICNVPIPTVFDKCSFIQPPTGLDGVLGNPVEWVQLNYLLGMKKERSLDIIVCNHL